MMALHSHTTRFSSKLQVLTITLLLISSRTEGDTDICFGKDGTAKPFNTNHEICCENSTFSKSRYLCCNDMRVNIEKCSPDGHHCEKQMCCGTKLVSEKNHLCCDNNLIELSDTEAIDKDDFRCCGKEYYNTGDRRICCGGSTIPSSLSRLGCCGGVVYDTTKRLCKAKKIVLPFQGVCNGVIYDKNASSCCGVKLNTKIPELLREQNRFKQNPAFGCCGVEVMDPQKKKCCPENIHRFPSHSIPKAAHIQCCGHGYFDANKQVCINDSAVQKGKYEEQCGSHKIDSRTQGCCDNKLPYDKETETCCKGSHHCILPKNGTCCNGYPVGENEICCQGRRPCKKGKEDDDECCYNYLTGRGHTYKSKNNQKCHRGNVVNIPPHYYMCGPSTFYSTHREICCRNKIYKKSEGYVTCCGDKGLKENEQCCEKLEKMQNFGKEIQREISTPCVKCGSYFINKETKSCCGGQFPYKIPSKRKECCSDRELYDKRYSRCTEDGRVEPLTSHKSFCRSSLFDGAIEEACLRKYGIEGKVRKIKAQTSASFTIVTFYLKRVKPVRRQFHSVLRAPRSLVLEIQTTLKKEMLCLEYFEKKPRRVMIFFDKPVRKNQVQIFQQQPFFMTRYTRRRYKDVTNAVTKKFCAHYQNFTS